MNVKRVSWGLVVLFVGLILLLTNLDYIQFNWFAVFSLWPVLLILVGLSFLLSEKEESKYVMIFATLGVLVLFAYQGLRTPSEPWFNVDFNTEDTGEWKEEQPVHAEHFRRDFDANIKRASLTLEGGVISYVIAESTDDLFVADTKSQFNFSLADKRNGDQAELDFVMRSEGENTVKGDNKVVMHLNSLPFWDIKLSLGAGKADFDLSGYKIQKLEVEGGVSSVKIKLGMPLEETEIKLESGLASFEILIPRGAACRINSDSALSSNDFEGFTKQADGSYISGDYQNANRKFTVEMESGLSRFQFRQY